LLKYYENSHVRALQSLYPEMNLNAEKFLKPGLINTLRLISQIISILTIASIDVDIKDFFMELAKSKNFDPFDVEKWYSVTHDDILQAVSDSKFMCTKVICLTSRMASL
jgi:hypothetical protein